MPGYEPLTEETNNDRQNESPLDENPAKADRISLPIHSEDPAFTNQLILDDEPAIGIFETDDRRYLLFCFLGAVGFQSCVAWKAAKTYFVHDINNPGLRFIVIGLAIFCARFIVTCIHWSVIGRFPFELILPDVFSSPMIYYEDHTALKINAIEFFSVVEVLCKFALFLQFFVLRRRFSMLAQKGIKIANDFWIDLCLVLCCQCCALAQIMRHMELRKNREPRLQVETV